MGLGEKNNYFFFAALATLLWGCGSKQRDQALQKAASPVAKERAAAVRALDGNDDASWLALVKAARDGAPAVRIEAAAAMARSGREEAPDGLAPLLRDPDDAVRIAASRALSQRCGERTEAYLRMAFARSDAQVRSQVIEALRACGKTAEDTLAREEAERRRKAAALLANPAAAQRARGARELGLLCREEDHAPLLTLLDDRDGVAAAAAARALGDCGASEAAPRLVALLGEGGEVAAAAAEALLALHAVEAARPQLRKLAVADGDEALSAAVALGRDCQTALQARSAKAAAVLAQGCPAKDVERVVAQFLRKGETDVVISQLALRSQVGGPALVGALRREQAARAKRIAERQPPPEADSAAEIAKAGVPGAPEKERYAQLMARLQERQGAQQARNSASTRLGEILRSDGQSDRRDFIAASLRAVLALHAPGAGKVAAAFAQDPDPEIAAAARGEAEPEARKAREPAPLDPRTALWSDDGAVRAEACSKASALDETRKMLAYADPERRVRVACARKDR